jgi:hypothetical protein
MYIVWPCFVLILVHPLAFQIQVVAFCPVPGLKHAYPFQSFRCIPKHTLSRRTPERVSMQTGHTYDNERIRKTVEGLKKVLVDDRSKWSLEYCEYVLFAMFIHPYTTRMLIEWNHSPFFKILIYGLFNKKHIFINSCHEREKVYNRSIHSR